MALSTDDARLAGLWWAKTLLLQARPRARYADPVVEQHALRWREDHPLERAGTAVRLVPPSGAVDLRNLPIDRRRAIAWMRCRVTLRDGALDSPDLPGLSPSMYPFTALPELLPFVTPWAG